MRTFIKHLACNGYLGAVRVRRDERGYNEDIRDVAVTEDMGVELLEEGEGGGGFGEESEGAGIGLNGVVEHMGEEGGGAVEEGVRGEGGDEGVEVEDGGERDESEDGVCIAEVAVRGEGAEGEEFAGDEGEASEGVGDDVAVDLLKVFHGGALLKEMKNVWSVLVCVGG